MVLAPTDCRLHGIREEAQAPAIPVLQFGGKARNLCLQDLPRKLLEQLHEGTADDDTIGSSGHLCSLRRIGNAEADGNRK